jgi:hypothetical protein
MQSRGNGQHIGPILQSLLNIIHSVDKVGGPEPGQYDALHDEMGRVRASLENANGAENLNPFRYEILHLLGDDSLQGHSFADLAVMPVISKL